MTLTDDQLRSLREVAEEAARRSRVLNYIVSGDGDGAVEVHAPSVLALVEEVERARHQHVTDPEGTSYCSLAEHYATALAVAEEAFEKADTERMALQVEVDTRRQHCNCGPDGCNEEHPLAPCIPCRSLDCEMPCIYETAVDPLDAKAEAGKGLAEYAAHAPGCNRRRGPEKPCTCGFDAALAQWEAANAE